MVAMAKIRPLRRKRRCGGFFLFLAVVPVGVWLVKPLEDEYARRPLPRHIDGILTLGGMLNSEIYISRAAPSDDPAEGRFVGAVELLRLHPEARLVFSGGSGAAFPPPRPAA